MDSSYNSDPTGSHDQSKIVNQPTSPPTSPPAPGPGQPSGVSGSAQMPGYPQPLNNQPLDWGNNNWSESPPNNTSKGPLAALVAIAALALVLLIGLGSFLFVRSTNDPESQTLTTDDSPSAAAESNSSDEFSPVVEDDQTAEVSIASGQIVAYEDAAVDFEVGELVEFSGTNFDGESVSVSPDGRIKVVYFLAHWCPHCQAEVKVVQQIINDGLKPDDLDIYSVSTLVRLDPSEPSPQRWLESVGWSSPVVRDDESSKLFKELGGRGTPYVIYLDGENKIIERVSGVSDRETTISIWNDVVE